MPEKSQNPLKCIKAIDSHYSFCCQNGNKIEERLVNIMGGTVIETESERLRKEGKVQMIVEMGQEYGLDDDAILKKMQDKIGLSMEQAAAYLEQYGKQPV